MVCESGRQSHAASQTNAPGFAKPQATPGAVRRCRQFLLPALFGLSFTGCVHRIVTIQSDPPGALVYMNEQEIGRTPLSKEFLWYGNYDLVLRKDGYQTVKTQAAVMPPWWQIIPIDLITEAMPLTDVHKLTYGLRPQPPVDPGTILARGEEMRDELESSEHTKARKPATKPTTQPTTRSTAKAEAPDVHPGLR